MKEDIPKEFLDLPVGGQGRGTPYNLVDLMLCLAGEEDMGLPVLDNLHAERIL